MFLPLEQTPVPPTSPKLLFSRQAVSQTLPPRAWASSEIAAVTLGVILGVIILIALGYLANHILGSLMRKIEQSVFERVQEDLVSTQERRNAALGIGNSQESGPSGRYLPSLRQQIGRRASRSPLPPAERQSDIEYFPDYRVPRPHIRYCDARETSPLDAGQISQRPDSPYRGPSPHPTAYHQAQPISPGERREWERETEALMDTLGEELPRPRSLASPPLPRSRGREQNRRQRDIESVGRIDRTHLPRQSSLPPSPEPWRGERVRYVTPHVSSANNLIQSNERYEAGAEYGER